jgi:dTMP kinase
MQHFMSLEGGEGAGKSTLLRFIETYLAERNYQVLVTREPGGSFLGEEIREMVLHHKRGEPIVPMAELLLFLAARAQHIETLIKPALKEKKVVICDRFTDSTIAYQAYARGLDLKLVKDLCFRAASGIEPGLTLYLDVPPEIGIKRAANRNTKIEAKEDRIEEEALDFHQKVRDGFLQIAKEDPTRVAIIDTAKSKENVQAQAKEVIDRWLKEI